jgi:hypothetical protein
VGDRSGTHVALIDTALAAAIPNAPLARFTASAPIISCMALEWTVEAAEYIRHAR